MFVKTSGPGYGGGYANLEYVSQLFVTTSGATTVSYVIRGYVTSTAGQPYTGLGYVGTRSTYPSPEAAETALSELLALVGRVSAGPA